MPNKKKLTKEQKKQLTHAKMRMNEAIHELKVDKKIKKEIKNKKIVHPKLLESPIIKNGVTNNFLKKEQEYQSELKKFKNMDTGVGELQELKDKNAEMISKLKAKYKSELKHLKSFAKDTQKSKEQKSENAEMISKLKAKFKAQSKELDEKVIEILSKSKDKYQRDVEQINSLNEEVIKSEDSKFSKEKMISKLKVKFKAQSKELKDKSVEILSKTKIQYKSELRELKNLKKGIDKLQELKADKEKMVSKLNARLEENSKEIKNKYLILKNEAKVKVHKHKEFMKTEEALINEEVKEITKLNKSSKGQVSMKNLDGDIITLKNVNKYYSQKHMIFKALADVNVSIKKGTFNVILGPSGSGKTTLLNMISGLDRNTYGDVVINGTNIAALSTKELTQFRRKYIGFVFQSYNLLASLDVSDNIEVGRSLQQDPKKRVNITDLLQDMDMSQNEKKKTYELSGGQQQRVSIARALAKSPEILIGDEPTGALDQKTSLKVFELFQDINKKQKSTVIIVTHNVNVAKLADQVIHVKNGRIDKVVINKNPLQAKNMKEI